jgi:hypothetical protein
MNGSIHFRFSQEKYLISLGISRWYVGTLICRAHVLARIRTDTPYSGSSLHIFSVSFYLEIICIICCLPVPGL